MDADLLRIVLALLGALVIAGLYFWERRRRTRDEDPESGGMDPPDGDAQNDKREPRLGPWEGYVGSKDGSPGERAREDDAGAHPVQAGAVAAGSGGRQETSRPELTSEPLPGAPKDPLPEFPAGPMLLILHVVARGGPYEGAAIVHAAGHCGLEPGEMDIFHCSLGDKDHPQTLFSMANMVKPGTFPFGAMAAFRSPGLTLFAQLEGTPDDPGRMEELLGTAHALADELDGELRDERRKPLTLETERRLRERVMAFIEVRLTANPA